MDLEAREGDGGAAELAAGIPGLGRKHQAVFETSARLSYQNRAPGGRAEAAFAEKQRASLSFSSLAFRLSLSTRDQMSLTNFINPFLSAYEGYRGAQPPSFYEKFTFRYATLAHPLTFQSHNWGGVGIVELRATLFPSLSRIPMAKWRAAK